MSVVVRPSHPHPSPRTGWTPAARRRVVPAGPVLTITVDLSPGAGPITPRLSRLLELLGELVGAEQEIVRVSGPDLVPVATGVEPATHGAESGPSVLVAVGPRFVPPDRSASGGASGHSLAGPGAQAPPADHSGAQVRILTGTRMVLHDDRLIALTRLEFDLLLFLAEHPRQVFTRRQLLSAVWGYDHAVARTVDVHVRRLRAKAGPDLSLITTVYGVGYRLADEAWITIEDSR